MLTTLLKPYTITHAYRNGVKFDFDTKAQLVSYYVGYDVEDKKLLDLSILPEPRNIMHAQNLKAITAWLSEESRMEGIFLLETIQEINQAAQRIYTAFDKIKSQNLGDLEVDVGKIIDYQANIKDYRCSVRLLIERMYFFCSALLFRANHLLRADNALMKDEIILGQRITSFRWLYELLELNDPDALKIKELIFKNDTDNLIEKLVVEIVAMHDLSALINNFAQVSIGKEHPTLLMKGPPKDEGYLLLVHNHALPQIMEGLNLMIAKLGIFGAGQQS